MNAKKCKQLRRIAERVTVGKPERRYIANLRGTAGIVDPNTTRGQYRLLKKAAQGRA